MPFVCIFLRVPEHIDIYLYLGFDVASLNSAVVSGCVYGGQYQASWSQREFWRLYLIVMYLSVVVGVATDSKNYLSSRYFVSMLAFRL